MKKSHKRVRISFSIFLCLFMLLSIKQSVYADVIENSRNGILPDKEWKINFNNKVDYDYVNSNYIYVMDSSGNTVDVDVKVNPLNEKQVIVKPKLGKYKLGSTYTLIISKEFCDEKGNKIGQDHKMQFAIKKQLIDTADFKIQGNKSMGVMVISINSITSTDIKKYRVEGQDPKDTDYVDINGEAVIWGTFKSVNVYFYDSDGKEIGNSLINVEKACDSQTVQIIN